MKSITRKRTGLRFVCGKPTIYRPYAHMQADELADDFRHEAATARRLQRLAARGEGGPHAVARRRQQGVDERRLVLEVVVEGALRQAGGVGDDAGHSGGDRSDDRRDYEAGAVSCAE